MDNRSKYFILVPFCLMAQAFQAQEIVKYEWKSSIKPFMKLLIEKDINIIQMPCAEATFENNLIREAKGLSKYNTEKFNAHCERISEEVSNINPLTFRLHTSRFPLMPSSSSPSGTVIVRLQSRSFRWIFFIFCFTTSLSPETLISGRALDGYL